MPRPTFRQLRQLANPMGGYDTLPEAQRLAFLTAKSLALDQAVTYLDTVSAVKQLGLNREELRAYSVGLLEVRQSSRQTPGVGPATDCVGTCDHRD